MATFAQKLEDFAVNRNARGCTPSEVGLLSFTNTVTLPDTYRQFLLVAGHGIDDFLTGSDFTIDDLEGVREAANELLTESGLDPLPCEAFVFAMHQGYQFYFFMNGEVYYYREGMDHVERRYGSFDEFFDSVVTTLSRQKP